MQKDKRSPQPQYQPITMLPRLAQIIDGMLTSNREQHENLSQARTGDYTVNRVIKVFTEQQPILGIYDEQLCRWSVLQLTEEQRREVERLKAQMKLLRESNGQVLELAGNLSKRTIEKIMKMDDAELGLRMLMGEM